MFEPPLGKTNTGFIQARPSKIQGLFKDKSYHFQGLGVDAVVGGSVLTFVSFLIKKFVEVPDKDCSCFLCRSPLACERKVLSPI